MHWGFWDKMPGNVLLSHTRSTLSSALNRFTSEFGMGSGGTSSLSSPDKLVVIVQRGRTSNDDLELLIKSHDQLVLVSFMHCCTSTSSLSTLSSTTDL